MEYLGGGSALDLVSMIILDRFSSVSGQLIIINLYVRELQI